MFQHIRIKKISEFTGKFGKIKKTCNSTRRKHLYCWSTFTANAIEYARAKALSRVGRKGSLIHFVEKLVYRTINFCI